MIKLKNFRFKVWHFCLLFVLLISGINIWAVIETNKNSNDINGEDIHIEELKDMSYINTDSSGVISIIFYQENSDVCNKMMSNINKISDINLKFYKLNINNHLDIYTQYNISGVPCTLIFKDGKEINRIMGVVPVTNLEIIYKRTQNKTTQSKTT